MIDRSLLSGTERKVPGFSLYKSSIGSCAAIENSMVLSSAFLWPSALLHKTELGFIHSAKKRRRVASFTNFRRFAVSGLERPGLALRFFFLGVHGTSSSGSVFTTISCAGRFRGGPTTSTASCTSTTASCSSTTAASSVYINYI